MRAMTPGDLLELLDRRLDLLAQPSGVGDDRHSSLRAAIDASYQQLPDDHQRLFRRMGVFPAPVDLELVRRVAAAPGADVVDVLDVVGQLVDRSLVVADQPASGGTQYRLYDSIRAFALEQLDAAGEAADLRERYVDELAAVADAVVADAVEHWSPELMNSIVERFLPFIRAVEWSLEDPTPARAYRLLVPLYGPTHGSHAPAVAALARKVLDRWDGRGTPLRAEALAVGATAMLLSGDLDGAFARGHEALADPAASALAGSSPIGRSATCTPTGRTGPPALSTWRPLGCTRRATTPSGASWRSRGRRRSTARGATARRSTWSTGSPTRPRPRTRS